jgi:PAS domain S-box-containing protein/diguanylate cyclase (GGDEF)-like protein
MAGVLDTPTFPAADSLLAALLLESDDGIATTDLHGVVTSWNPAAERLSGAPAAAVLGRHLADAVPPAGRQRACMLLGEVLRAGETARMQTPWRRPDGEVLHVGITMCVLRADGGAAAGTSIVVRDLSGQRAADRRGRETEQRMRRVVEMAHDAFLGMDEDGRINGWNRAAELLFGWTADEVDGRRLADTIIPERLRRQHVEGRRPFFADGHAELDGKVLELVVADRRGAEFPVELRMTPVREEGHWSFNAFVRDLRERDAAAATQARLAAIVKSSADAIFSTDAEGRIDSWNPGAERLLGHPPAWALGRHVSQLTPRDRAGEDEQILRPVLAGGSGQAVETERLHRDGHRVEVSLAVSGIRDGAGAVVGASIVAREIGARLRRARTDDLTGLPGRQVFVDRLDAALARHSAEGGRAAGAGGLAVAIVDVDRFHELNEAVGRDGGDRILRGLVEALAAALPPGTLLARLGSDQFGAMLETAPGGGDALGRALQAALPAVIAVDDLSLHVDASAGEARGPEDGARAEVLLGAADRAVRGAKRTRSGFERYEAARHGGVGASVTVVGQLAGAIDRGELVLHFQPQVDLALGRVTGAEALIRWQHPARGLLKPCAFLPSVERSSLMRRITGLALRQALEQAQGWREAGFDLAVSVNLSVLNLLDLSIAHDVAEQLGAHGVPPESLRLEITEDSLMADPGRAAGVLAGLRAMGVGLSIDDFGTGYSSLSYLQRLPVSELKIDRCFVRDVARNPSDAAIVRATVDMARTLGLRTVAEGVEDEAGLATLRELGCDMVQGYHVGRPMPPAELQARLGADRAP